ncbi:hypothetical protein D7Z26_07150 [Cohnella endophytica]|uniref:SLH domain-containing protein n=1 Tax=Cohnella endophytica TaxID=2419778 RepID=A0A494Y3C9_9BACL|nr:GLUG motif-containing protein [Cohnella endophytica]RKP55001.1 hypothetical protein D7Z26_07150 [Cohnella endophytica]
MRTRGSKILIMMLVMAMMFGGVTGWGITGGGKVFAADSGDFDGGTGTSGDPFQINTAAQLDNVRDHVEAGVYFELTNDIDLSSYSSGEGWLPIANFGGSLDGNGFIIMNLKINRPGDNLIGLFGKSAWDSKFINIVLENMNVQGNNHVGGLVGYNEGGSINNSYATGSVGGDSYVGGLVGYNYGGTISNSYVTASASGAHFFVGGLVGYNIGYSFGGTIYNSYATGNVHGGDSYVGGLVGYNYGSYSGGTISNSYATGNVSGNNNLGGLVGQNQSYNNGGTISDSFYDSTTTGQSDSGKGTGVITANMQKKDTFTSWNFNSDWYVIPGQYPRLWALTALTEGTDVGTTKIVHVANGMEYSIGNGEYTAFTNTSLDNIPVNAGDTISVRVAADISSAKTLTVSLTDIKPANAPTTAALTVGTNITGTTQISGVTDLMEYKVGSGSYTAIASTSVDNIVVSEGDNIYVRVRATTQPASIAQVLTVALANIKIGSIKVPAIALTAPEPYATPVLSLAPTAEYTATVAWLPADEHFKEEVPYTATITLTPKSGYTFSGVTSNFFTVAGATATNSAQSGVVTAAFSATSAAFDGGTGTEDNPYRIATASQFDKVRYVLEEGVYFKLTADIDLSSYGAGEGWDPIGSYDDDEQSGAFQGNMDGNGHTIKGLKISNSSNNPVGLFGTVGENGSIRNMIVEDVNIDGGYAVGGLVGLNFGTIANSCYATGNVSGSDNYAVGGLVGINIGTISKSYATGDVSGSDTSEVGGLVGYNEGTITNSYVTGSVSGDGDVGGLVGYNEGTITKSYVTGSVSGDGDVGGLVGYNEGTITNSYATGSVSGDGNVGGLVGYNHYNGDISSSYATGSVSEAEEVGGLVGFNNGDVSDSFYDIETTGQEDEGKGIGKSTEDMIKKDTYVAEDWDFSDTWAISATRNGSYPYLQAIQLYLDYDGNGKTSGSAPIDAISYMPGSPVAVKANTGNLARSGYTFTGWNTKADGSGTTYAPAAKLKLTENSILYAKWTANAPGNGGGYPSDTKVTSTDGKLTLPAGRAGEVSLENAVVITIPANATGKDLKLTIDKVLDAQKLLTSKDILITAVYEILKNFPENFDNPVTLTFTFDPASLKSGQKASVFYYDETKKEWVEIAGSKVSGNHISVTVNHFTKFAVLSVNQTSEVPDQNPKPTITFSDIAGHWAESAIKQAVSHGIVSGYPDGTFKPNHTVTRAEFTVMLMNTLKSQGTGAALTFSDEAKIGVWAKPALAQAVQAGIIKGFKDGTFRPGAAITRAEMASMVANALQLQAESTSATGFADDKDIPSWAKGSIAAIKKLGLVSGNGSNAFAPAANTTRAEAITVLLNVLTYMSK